MRNLSTIMKDYFNEGQETARSSFLMTEQRSVPIIPNVIQWKRVTDPERLMRRFEFVTRNRLIDFLSLVFELEDEMNHHGRISIDHLHVDIEVYTKTVDCVTEIDIEYTKSVSEIYEDVQHYVY
jgi:pterin-4a-carbinolamine dehydratase